MPSSPLPSPCGSAFPTFPLPGIPDLCPEDQGMSGGGRSVLGTLDCLMGRALRTERRPLSLVRGSGRPPAGSLAPGLPIPRSPDLLHLLWGSRQRRGAGGSRGRRAPSYGSERSGAFQGPNLLNAPPPLKPCSGPRVHLHQLSQQTDDGSLPPGSTHCAEQRTEVQRGTSWKWGQDCAPGGHWRGAWGLLVDGRGLSPWRCVPQPVLSKS